MKADKDFKEANNYREVKCCANCVYWKVECFPDNYPDWAEPDNPEHCPEYTNKVVYV